MYDIYGYERTQHHHHRRIYIFEIIRFLLWNTLEMKNSLIVAVMSQS